MLPAEDLFVHCYVLVDDLIKNGWVVIPPRPGPAPACTDAEIITIGLVRHLLCRRSEAGFLGEIHREWPALFPTLPHPSEVNRRTRWLYGAYEQIRAAVLAAVPADDWGQIDTSALPVKHPSRVRGPDSWTGPTNCVPASGAMPRTASGSTASVSRCAPTWGRGWFGPGRSFTLRSTNATSFPA